MSGNLKNWLIPVSSIGEKRAHRDESPTATNSVVSSNEAKKCKHRKSGFDSRWRATYPWLQETPDNLGMVCNLCTKFKKTHRSGTNGWTSLPCTTMTKYSIDKHLNSLAHRDAVKAEADLIASKEEGGIVKAIDGQINLQKMAFLGALKCLYWLAKNEIPHTTKFAPLLDLVKSLGCSYFDHLDQGKNAHYTSERMMQEMLEALVTPVSAKIFKDLNQSAFFSLLIDETTDIAILKQLIVYGRYVTSNGKVKTSFLGMEDIPDGKAETIEEAIRSLVKNKVGVNIDSKLVGLGSDGAAVMVGRRNGVAARLKTNNDKLISFHCVNHKAALAAGQACDAIPYLKKFSNLLQQLYQFYQNSPVRMAGLKEIEKVLGEPQLKFSEAKHVRWLSHHKAVEAVRKTLPSLIMSLEREASERHDAAAVGLARFVKCYDFVASVHMMCDVLPHLTRLSLMFQKSDLDLTLVEPMIESTIIAIENMSIHPGPYMVQLPEEMTKLQDSGHGITYNDKLKENYQNQIFTKYLHALVENLKCRFGDTNVINNFNMFDPDLLQTDDSGFFQDFEQQEKLQLLCDHFVNDVKKEDAISEWGVIRGIINRKKELKYKGVLSLIQNDFKDIAPNLHKLCTAALVMPLSTAEYKRGFSAVNRIKSSLRNRLSQKIFQYLLFISIEGPATEDIPIPTVH